MICFLVMQTDLSVQHGGPSFPPHAQDVFSEQKKVGDRLFWS